jgi:hypothetical protein
MAMCVCAFIIEFTVSRVHEVSAQLRFVIDFEIFNISQHLFARLEIHLLLFPVLFAAVGGRKSWAV